MTTEGLLPEIRPAGSAPEGHVRENRFREGPPEDAPRVLIETHGCKLNMADSQRMAREFLTAGYAIARDGETPDVYILDSCTVTHVADRKARQALARARRAFPEALIVATGCLAQRDAEAVDGLAAVDLVVTNQQKRDMARTVTDRLGVTLSPSADGALPKGSGALLGRSRASVKIQEGCDQVCAYCIVPRVRGRERSVPVETLIRQTARLVDEGCREVVLTGTQLGSYGFDLPDTSLAAMLRRVLVDTRIERLRVSSLQPGEITGELLDVWSSEGEDRLCPHFHMALQSGSDAVLKRMRRRYIAGEFVVAAQRVRSALTHVSITGDVISGFPGETEDDHRSTLEIVERVGLADLHVFPYSERPGTSAAHFNEAVEPAIRTRRAAELRELASRMAGEFRRGVIGTVRPVLWEGGEPAVGFTDTYLRVRRASTGGSAAPANPDAPGDLDNVIERVRLVRMDGGVLIGEPVQAHGD